MSDKVPKMVMKEEVWEDPTPRKKSPTRFIPGLFLLLAIYVLSIGPAFYLNEKGYITNNVTVIYKPVIALCNVSPQFRDVLFWYVRLWRK